MIHENQQQSGREPVGKIGNTNHIFAGEPNNFDIKQLPGGVRQWNKLKD